MFKGDRSIKVILTGATGFVGEGVLLECIVNPHVAEVLMVNRKALAFSHPKVKECIVADFANLDSVATQLMGYDACFFCAGVSSSGLDEAAYTRITYTTTIAFAQALAFLNPGMTFNFVSGRRTDSSESGKIMWARVKGRTENALMAMKFKGQYNFRPGGMVPVSGQKNVKSFYRLAIRLIGWFAPGSVVSLHDVGKAMIHAALYGYTNQILEVADIKKLSDV